jgi:uncharacterized ion transporter superfamily protein YfcC
MKFSKLKAPNTFLLIFLFVLVTAVLTWIIPGGEYTRQIKDGTEIVIGDSFRYVESNPQSIGSVLIAPLNGFVDAALIIGFVLIVGGAFGVFQKTQAVNSAIRAIAKSHSDSKFIRKMIIPLFMIFFSLAGAIFGMSEEVIPFVLVFIPLALALGYDTVTGVAVPFIGAGAGFAGAFLNPFTVGIAQGIADVPLFSGIEYRIITWMIITAVAIFYVEKYAKKIKLHPELSFTHKADINKRKKINFDKIENHARISKRHKLVLITFFLGLVILVIGVLQFGWYIEELSAVFLVTGIAVGIVGRLNVGQITDSLIQGAKDLVGTALIIGLARGILVVARDGKIIDTILYALSEPISSFHPVVSSQAMFIVQTMINFFIPSGSGQAALTMPVMAPLSDLVGVSRQTAVLAFQFGDGFSNMIIPTSAVTMGVLTLADIPWEKWARWILPLEIIFLIIGLLLLIPPYLLGWR